MKVSVFPSIVALSRFDRVAGTARDDFDLSVLSVFRGVGRNVAEAVLTPELFRNLIEDLLKIVLTAQCERRAAGFFGVLLQRSDIATSAESTAASTPSVRAEADGEAASGIEDSVDHRVAAMRGDERLVEFDP